MGSIKLSHKDFNIFQQQLEFGTVTRCNQQPDLSTVRLLHARADPSDGLESFAFQKDLRYEYISSWAVSEISQTSKEHGYEVGWLQRKSVHISIVLNVFEFISGKKQTHFQLSMGMDQSPKMPENLKTYVTIM